MGSNQEAKSSFPDPELTNDLRKLVGLFFLPPSPSCSLPRSTTHGSYGYFSKITLCPFLPPTQPERKQGKDKNIAWEERARTSPPKVAPVLSAWGRGGGRGGPAGHLPARPPSLSAGGHTALLPSCPHHRTAGSVAAPLPCLLLNRFSHLILTVTLPTGFPLLQTSLIRELDFLQGWPTNKQEDCDVSSAWC